LFNNNNNNNNTDALAAIPGEPDDQMTNNTTRLDAVCDTYQDASLKSQACARRGEALGRRTRVSAKIPIPKGLNGRSS